MASLCRLLEAQGRVEEWQKQIGELRELYAWFTEGFETEDLRVVKEVLDSAGETE